MDELNRALENLSGMIVGGKYILGSLVGEGGMAYVYRGLHKDLNHPIAFKVLFSNLARRPEVRERFQQEARLQFRLQHPNIVRVIDMIEEHGMLGIVLDWVEGRDLGHYLKQKNGLVSLAEIRRLFVPMLTAIGYAHDQQIIHRDIKPTNVLLEGAEGREVPKIMDFGIAKSLEGDNFKTKTGLMVGTPFYMSPEQIQGVKNIDHRADIYSLGVTLFQMLTGRLPFEGENAWEVVSQHYLREPPTLALYRLDLSSEWDRVIRTAMAKAPDQRYSSARAFARAILPLLPDLDPTTISQDELDAIVNSGTAPNMTAWGHPPVPQGWHSPGTTSFEALQKPVVSDVDSNAQKTSFSWEYTGEREVGTAFSASVGSLSLPLSGEDLSLSVGQKTVLPTGEQWGYTSHSPEVRSDIVLPSAQSFVGQDAWLSAQHGAEQTVQADADSVRSLRDVQQGERQVQAGYDLRLLGSQHPGTTAVSGDDLSTTSMALQEKPEQVTPPYARPLPFAVPEEKEIFISVQDSGRVLDSIAVGVKDDKKYAMWASALPELTVVEPEPIALRWYERVPLGWKMGLGVLVVLSVGVVWSMMSSFWQPTSVRVPSSRSPEQSRGMVAKQGLVYLKQRGKVEAAVLGAKDSKDPQDRAMPQRLENTKADAPILIAKTQQVSTHREPRRNRDRQTQNPRSGRKRVKQLGSSVKKAGPGHGRLCMVCVSKRFASYRNKATIGMMEEAELSCNMNDFQETSRVCARVCGHNHLLFCKAAMKASSGKCGEWIEEKTLLSSYEGSLTSVSVKRCRSEWANE